MGQKVNPNGLRIGINRAHSSHWFADNKKFTTYVSEDIKIREYLNSKLDDRKMGLSHIDIERTKQQVKVSVHLVQVALVLGEDGSNVKAIEKHLNKLVKPNGETAKLVLYEVKKPDFIQQ